MAQHVKQTTPIIQLCLRVLIGVFSVIIYVGCVAVKGVEAIGWRLCLFAGMRVNFNGCVCLSVCVCVALTEMWLFGTG